MHNKSYLELERIIDVQDFTNYKLGHYQTFDDWYEFKNNYTTGGPQRKIDVPRYTQVGNAIPPLFMEHAGGVLKVMI